jgi:hypothetical protein
MSILLPPKSTPGLPQPIWLPGPEFPDLDSSALHVWRARLDTAMLDSESCPVSRQRSEQMSLALFRNDILGRYTFSGDTSAPLRFAIAQCDHVALLAISRSARGVGLDVERVRDDIPIDDMADGFLDLHSQWDLRITWSLQEKAWKFFQFWTSNEACEQARPFSASGPACKVRGFSPESDFIAALAVESGPEPGVVYWDWLCHGY